MTSGPSVLPVYPSSFRAVVAPLVTAARFFTVAAVDAVCIADDGRFARALTAVPISLKLGSIGTSAVGDWSPGWCWSAVGTVIKSVAGGAVAVGAVAVKGVSVGSHLSLSTPFCHVSHFKMKDRTFNALGTYMAPVKTKEVMAVAVILFF